METVRTETLQAQGWENWLSQLIFAGGTLLSKIDSKIYQDLPFPAVGSAYANILMQW